jgi:hypothetical protein
MNWKGSGHGLISDIILVFISFQLTNDIPSTNKFLHDEIVYIYINIKAEQ